MSSIEQALRSMSCEEWGRVAESIVNDTLADMRTRTSSRTPGARTPLVRLYQGDKRIDYTPSLAEAREESRPRGSGQRWWRGMVSRLRRFGKGMR